MLFLIDLSGSDEGASELVLSGRMHQAADDPAATAAAAVVGDPSLACLHRCVRSLARGDQSGSLGQPDECLLTALLHEMRAFVRGAVPAIVVCLAPGRRTASQALASLAFAQSALEARFPTDTPSPQLSQQLSQFRHRLAQQVAERERMQRENERLRGRLADSAAESAALTARAEAAESALEAMRTLRAQGEGLHAEFAREARVLGLLCRQEKHHELALRLQQRARRLHEQSYGPRHQEVARDLSHIGSLLCDLNRLEEAAEAFREAHQLDSVCERYEREI